MGNYHNSASQSIEILKCNIKVVFTKQLLRFIASSIAMLSSKCKVVILTTSNDFGQTVLVLILFTLPTFLCDILPEQDFFFFIFKILLYTYKGNKMYLNII